jgi:hypothetical protein
VMTSIQRPEANKIPHQPNSREYSFQKMEGNNQNGQRMNHAAPVKRH